MNQKLTCQKSPLFKVRIHRTLELVNVHRSIGRKRLAEKLGVGEGVMRTILNFLKNNNLVASTPQGHVLTREGERELEEISRNFLQLERSELTVGEVNVATIVRNASERIKLGIEQRDEAIKAGAEGATILIYTEGKLKLPGKQVDLEPEIKDKLLGTFKPKNGDVIIIGTGNTEASAELGVLAAAASLSD